MPHEDGHGASGWHPGEAEKGERSCLYFLLAAARTLRLCFVPVKWIYSSTFSPSSEDAAEGPSEVRKCSPLKQHHRLVLVQLNLIPGLSYYCFPRWQLTSLTYPTAENVAVFPAFPPGNLGCPLCVFLFYLTLIPGRLFSSLEKKSEIFCSCIFEQYIVCFNFQSVFYSLLKCTLKCRH